MNLLSLFYIVNQTHALLKIMVLKGGFSETFLINNLKNLFFHYIKSFVHWKGSMDVKRKVLQGTINADKEPLFLRVQNI